MIEESGKKKESAFSISDTTKIKGWAIILMFMHHCFLAPERYEGQVVDFSPFSEHFINNVALSMKICVALFVFISAYGITLSYKKACGSDYDRLSPSIISAAIYRRAVKLWTSFFFIFLLAQMYSIIVVREGRFTYVYGTGIKGAVNCAIDAMGLAEMFHTPTFLATFWYISLAWIIIFTMPVFIIVYHRVGTMSLLFAGVLISVAFSYNGGVEIANFPRYAFVMATGIIAADKDLIVTIGEFHRIPKVIKLLLYIIAFMMLICVRQITRTTPILPVWDGIIALLTCVMFYEFFNRWFIIKDVLHLIGKYATDMFLIHNFIRIVWYYDFTYSFHRWWLIIVVLLAISLAVSIIIEGLKKLIRYDRLIDRLLAY